MLRSHNIRLLPSAVVLGLLLAPGLACAQAQNFQLTVNNVVSYTDFHPNGISDVTPPYVMCRGYQLGIRLKYTWRHGFAEQVSTEPVGTFYPEFFALGVSPNPVHLPAAQAGQPLIRLVDTGLRSGPVNTAGLKTVTYRGRTLLNYDPNTGDPRAPLTASVNVVIDNQFQPSSTRYRILSNNSVDMPTRPWLAWTDDLSSTNYRVDVDRCTSQTGQAKGAAMCSDMEFEPYDANDNNPVCFHSRGVSDYCTIIRPNQFQLPVTLSSDTLYEYRVLGRNTCGLSNEVTATPVGRPLFRTAQACFISNAQIPDGGSLNLDVATIIRDAGTPFALAPNLRVTVHSNHSRVSDLKISLTKTSPVVFGPLVLMDRPGPFPGATSCDGQRIQAVFSDSGPFVNGSCRADEPALRGTIGPVQNLTAMAPAQGAGNWRLTGEDAVATGSTGSLLEWCLSSDIPLQAAAIVQNEIMADGFEDRGG